MNYYVHYNLINYINHSVYDNTINIKAENELNSFISTHKSIVKNYKNKRIMHKKEKLVSHSFP